MKKFGFLCVVVFSLVAQSAMADYMGLANGRSANMDNMADMSVDAGINIGARTLFGARVNFKASSDLMVFGDIGMLDTDDFAGADSDGLVYGFGAFYQLRNVNLLENTDFAVKGAYHLGTLEVGNGFDLDMTEITIEALISGDQLADTDFGWYANVGMHFLDFEVPSAFFGGSDSENEVLIGGGITGSLSFGEFFAGVDLINGAQFVAGVRYNL